MSHVFWGYLHIHQTIVSHSATKHPSEVVFLLDCKAPVSYGKIPDYHAQTFHPLMFKIDLLQATFLMLSE